MYSSLLRFCQAVDTLGEHFTVPLKLKICTLDIGDVKKYLTTLKIFYCNYYLHLLDEADEPLLGDLLGREDLGGEGLGDDGDDPGQVGVVRPEDVLVVALDQVGQEPVHVRRLVHVLSHRQPREPAGENISV